MASVCYTHSPRFVSEAAVCLEEFQECGSRLSHYMNAAAAEVTLELMKMSVALQIVNLKIVVIPSNQS